MTSLTTCPSFIDLRAFAGASCLDVADPFGAGRQILPLRSDDVDIGAIHLMPGSGRHVATGGDLFLIVAQGAVALTLAGEAWSLGDADSCVVADGQEVLWSTQTPTILIYMRHTQGSSHPGPGALIDHHAALTPSGAPLAELLVGPTPACRNNTQFISTDEEFMCGTWDSTPYHRLTMPYRHFELMHLLAGSVTFVDETGRSGTFAKGDIFMIEQKAHCSWESRVDVAKVYAIYRPKA